jgi:MarR family transcriptional regulator for hemolysin
MTSLGREFAFTLNDVARLLRTLADQRVKSLDMTRAQWAVLMRLERYEGLKQAELAEMLDIAPITLTRLIDRLCDNGLVERRNDPTDRRAKRLHLLPAARPMVERLKKLGDSMLSEVLAGLDQAKIQSMLDDLNTVKDNLRAATQTRLAAE